jgi:hypothetical protein
MCACCGSTAPVRIAADSAQARADDLRPAARPARAPPADQLRRNRGHYARLARSPRSWSIHSVLAADSPCRPQRSRAKLRVRGFCRGGRICIGGCAPQAADTPQESETRSDGDASGQRIYAYAGNDPINGVDLSGTLTTRQWEACHGRCGNGRINGGPSFSGAGIVDSGGGYEGAFGGFDEAIADANINQTVPLAGGAEGRSYQVASAGAVAAPAGNAVPGLLDAIGAGILRILGTLGSVLSLSGDTPQSQTLYRAVDQQELASIQSTGNYTIPPGGTEGKYFYPTPGQAQNLANMYQAQGIGPGPYTLTSGQFQQQELPPPFPVSGEGQVYFLPANLFPRAATVYPR